MSLLAARRRDEAVQFMQANLSQWQNRILQAARRKLSKTGLHLSDDDLEEAYGTAWHELHAYQLDGGEVTNPEGWLVEVTARRYIDAQRKQRPGAYADNITTDDVEPVSHEDATELLDDQRKLAHLREGMRERLSDREIKVATLIYLHGYTRAETAKLLGIEAKRIEKIMDGDNKSRLGITKTFGAIVADIESGQWCEKRGSLMRAYAANILAPDGERYQLAREHLADCPACRRYVQGLRNLAGILPPVPLILAAAHGDHPFNQLAALVDGAGGALDRTRETIVHIAHQGQVHVDTVTAAGGSDGVGTIVKATGTGGGAAGAAAALAAGGGGGAAVAGGAGILAGGGGLVGLKIAATCFAVAAATGCVALTDQVSRPHREKPVAAKVAEHTRTQPEPPAATPAAAVAFASAAPAIRSPLAPARSSASTGASAQRSPGATSSSGSAQAPSASAEFGFERGSAKKKDTTGHSPGSSGTGGDGSGPSTSQAAQEFTPPPTPVLTSGSGSSSASSGSTSSSATRAFGPAATQASSARAEFGIEGG